MAKVNLPDGRVVNFPDGMSPQDMEAALNQVMGQSEFAKRSAEMDPTDLSIARSKDDEFGSYLREQASQPRAGESDEARFKRLYGGVSGPDVSTGGGMARAGFQGASYGGGDEIVAAGAAGLNRLTGKDPDRSFGELYDAYLSNERQKIGQFRKDSPVLAYGSEIAGAIPTAMALPGLGTGGALPSQMVRGGAEAALHGAGYGYLAGEGGAKERAGNAALTAGIAAPIGVAAPVVAAGARNLAQRLMTNKAAKPMGLSRPSYDILSRAMDSDGSLSGAGAANIRAAGPSAMIADAGPNARTLLDTAIQRSGPASTGARQAVEARATDANRMVTGALDDVLGQPAGLRGTARGIAQQTAAAREAAYQRAYSTPVNYASDAGRKVEAALERVPSGTLNKAIQTANDMMQSEGVRNMQIMAQVADDGAVTFREMPNVMQLDYIKRALNEIGSAVDQYGRPTGEALRAGKVARLVRDATTEAVPEYGVAVKLGGDKIERDNALRLGYDLLRAGTTREVVKEGAADLSDEAAQALRQGVRAYVDDTLSNVKRALTDTNMDAREAIKAVKDLSSRANREKLATVLGDEVANRMFNEIDQAAAALDLRASVAANSKTFARTAMDDVVRAQTDDGAINAFRSGEPVNAGRRLAQNLMGRTPEAKERIADKVYSEVANFLTGPRGNMALQSIQDLENTRRGIGAGSQRTRSLVDQLLRRNSAVTAPAYENIRR